MEVGRSGSTGSLRGWRRPGAGAAAQTHKARARRLLMRPPKRCTDAPAVCSRTDRMHKGRAGRAEHAAVWAAARVGGGACGRRRVWAAARVGGSARTFSSGKSRSGDETAATAASCARLLPEPRPIPRSALPAFDMIERTSAKSTLIRPGLTMISEMPMMPCARGGARAAEQGGRARRGNAPGGALSRRAKPYGRCHSAGGLVGGGRGLNQSSHQAIKPSINQTINQHTCRRISSASKKASSSG